MIMYSVYEDDDRLLSSRMFSFALMKHFDIAMCEIERCAHDERIPKAVIYVVF